jgi:hypothetical protein
MQFLADEVTQPVHISAWLRAGVATAVCAESLSDNGWSRSVARKWGNCVAVHLRSGVIVQPCLTDCVAAHRTQRPGPMRRSWRRAVGSLGADTQLSRSRRRSVVSSEVFASSSAVFGELDRMTTGNDERPEDTLTGAVKET